MYKIDAILGSQKMTGDRVPFLPIFLQHAEVLQVQRNVPMDPDENSQSMTKSTEKINSRLDRIFNCTGAYCLVPEDSNGNPDNDF